MAKVELSGPASARFGSPLLNYLGSDPCGETTAGAQACIMSVQGQTCTSPCSSSPDFPPLRKVSWVSHK